MRLPHGLLTRPWVLALLLLGSGGPAPAETIVARWDAAALQAVRDTQLGPPMVARALAVVHTCIYDAWAAYVYLAELEQRCLQLSLPS